MLNSFRIVVNYKLFICFEYVLLVRYVSDPASKIMMSTRDALDNAFI